jgi:peptide/nickel transport system substrate-binding protein
MRYFARRPLAPQRLLGLLVPVVAAAVVGVVGAGAAPAASGQLTWGVPQTVRGLDYTHSADPGSGSVIFLGMEPLVAYTKSGALKPDLATSFSVPNPKTYVFNLRRGVRFWDGSGFTSADVVYSLQRSAAKGSEVATFFGNVASIRANGRYRVTIKLKQPDPFFRYTIAVTPIGQKKFWSSHQKTIGTPAVLNMGTGPFRFASFTPGESVSMVRNDTYWGRKPAISKLTLKFIVDPNTMLLAIRSHQVDGTFKLPYQQIQQYKTLSGVGVQIAPEELTAYFSLDTASAPFNDVHVRRALAYATNKSGMVSAILRGYGAPAPTMPPPQQWGGLMPQKKVAALYKSLPHYNFDLTKAKAELARSGSPNGFQATVTFPDAHPELGKALQVLAQDAKSIGITLDVKQIPISQWLNTLYTHPTPMGMQVGNWTPDFPDPADALALIYASANAHANSFNTANYKNKAMDALIARQAKSVNASVRAQAIARALKLAAVDVAYVPLWYQEFGMALNSNYRYGAFGPWYTYQAWALDITPR